MHQEITTYGDILKILLECTPEQLAQEAQFTTCSTKNSWGEVTFGNVNGIGTVKDYFHDETTGERVEMTRSAYDWKHHPEDLVFLCDQQMFGDNGEYAEDLITGEKLYPKDHPLHEDYQEEDEE